MLNLDITLQYKSGFSLLEFVVTLGVGSIILAGVFSVYSSTMRTAVGQRQRIQCEQIARTSLDIISYDLRNAGAGMPIGLAGFLMSSGLGDTTYPILPNSDSDDISVRVSPEGIGAVLAASFNPASSTTITVASRADLGNLGNIYLFNLTTGSGLSAEITADGGALSFTVGSLVYTPGATFSKGTLVARVPTVRYFIDGLGTWGDPSRGNLIRSTNWGSGSPNDVSIAPNSNFAITFYDSTNTALPLPLTAADIANNLVSAEVTSSFKSFGANEGNITEVCSAAERIFLRNLVTHRNGI